MDFSLPRGAANDPLTSSPRLNKQQLNTQLLLAHEQLEISEAALATLRLEEDIPLPRSSSSPGKFTSSSGKDKELRRVRTVVEYWKTTIERIERSLITTFETSPVKVKRGGSHTLQDRPSHRQAISSPSMAIPNITLNTGATTATTGKITEDSSILPSSQSDDNGSPIIIDDSSHGTGGGDPSFGAMLSSPRGGGGAVVVSRGEFSPSSSPRENKHRHNTSSGSLSRGPSSLGELVRSAQSKVREKEMQYRSASGTGTISVSTFKKLYPNMVRKLKVWAQRAREGSKERKAMALYRKKYLADWVLFFNIGRAAIIGRRKRHTIWLRRIFVAWRRVISENGRRLIQFASIIGNAANHYLLREILLSWRSLTRETLELTQCSLTNRKEILWLNSRLKKRCLSRGFAPIRQIPAPGVQRHFVENIVLNLLERNRIRRCFLALKNAKSLRTYESRLQTTAIMIWESKVKKRSWSDWRLSFLARRCDDRYKNFWKRLILSAWNFVCVEKSRSILLQDKLTIERNSRSKQRVWTSWQLKVKIAKNRNCKAALSILDALQPQAHQLAAGCHNRTLTATAHAALYFWMENTGEFEPPRADHAGGRVTMEEDEEGEDSENEPTVKKQPMTPLKQSSEPVTEEVDVSPPKRRKKRLAFLEEGSLIGFSHCALLIRCWRRLKLYVAWRRAVSKVVESKYVAKDGSQDPLGASMTSSHGGLGSTVRGGDLGATFRDLGGTIRDLGATLSGGSTLRGPGSPSASRIRGDKQPDPVELPIFLCAPRNPAAKAAWLHKQVKFIENSAFPSLIVHSPEPSSAGNSIKDNPLDSHVQRISTHGVNSSSSSSAANLSSSTGLDLIMETSLEGEDSEGLMLDLGQCESSEKPLYPSDFTRTDPSFLSRFLHPVYDSTGLYVLEYQITTLIVFSLQASTQDPTNLKGRGGTTASRSKTGAWRAHTAAAAASATQRKASMKSVVMKEDGLLGTSRFPPPSSPRSLGRKSSVGATSFSSMPRRFTASAIGGGGDKSPDCGASASGSSATGLRMAPSSLGGGDSSSVSHSQHNETESSTGGIVVDSELLEAEYDRLAERFMARYERDFRLLLRLQCRLAALDLMHANPGMFSMSAAMTFPEAWLKPSRKTSPKKRKSARRGKSSSPKFSEKRERPERTGPIDVSSPIGRQNLSSSDYHIRSSTGQKPTSPPSTGKRAVKKSSSPTSKQKDTKGSTEKEVAKHVEVDHPQDEHSAGFHFEVEKETNTVEHHHTSSRQDEDWVVTEVPWGSINSDTPMFLMDSSTVPRLACETVLPTPLEDGSLLQAAEGGGLVGEEETGKQDPQPEQTESEEPCPEGISLKEGDDVEKGAADRALAKLLKINARKKEQERLAHEKRKELSAGSQLQRFLEMKRAVRSKQEAAEKAARDRSPTRRPLEMKQKLSTTTDESNLVRRLAQPSGDPELLNAKQKKIKELHKSERSSKSGAWANMRLGGSSLGFVGSTSATPNDTAGTSTRRPASALDRPGSGGWSTQPVLQNKLPISAHRRFLKRREGA